MHNIRIVSFAIGCALFLYAQTVDAATLKIAWDPPTDGVTVGYIVWIGTEPSNYTQSIDAGATISYAIDGLQEGATYFVAVQAYSAHREVSTISAPVSGIARTEGSLGLPGNAPPSAGMTSPLNGAIFTAPATITLSAAASDSDGSVTRVDFYANGSPIGSYWAPPYSISLPNIPAGNYTVSAVATDDRGATTTSAAVSVAVVSGPSGGSGPVSGMPGTATFVNSDSTTRGDWIGVHGRDGYALAADAITLPGYAQLAIGRAAQWTWADPSAEVRALRRASGAGRIAATAYGDHFSIDINLTDGQSHRVGVHGVDWDQRGRVQRFDIVDAATGALLDSRTMYNFTGGQYFFWTVRGHVRLEVTRLDGPNAVVSGLFFDTPNGGSGGSGGSGGATQATGSAAFIATDTTTKGNWRGVYGHGGYGLAGDVAALPSYAEIGVTGAAPWTWDDGTSDVRALQRANGSGRIAATAYGASFAIDVKFTDGQSHKLALYSVDWENQERAQLIEIFDAATGALLDSQLLRHFNGGVYLVWNVSGHVTVRVTNAGWPNAVVSAVFIE